MRKPEPEEMGDEEEDALPSVDCFGTFRRFRVILGVEYYWVDEDVASV